MDTLPPELIRIIAINLDERSLIRLWQTNSYIQSILDVADFKSLMYKRYDIFKMITGSPPIMLHKRRAMKLLDELSVDYHAGWGFDWDPERYLYGESDADKIYATQLTGVKIFCSVDDDNYEFQLGDPVDEAGEYYFKPDMNRLKMLSDMIFPWKRVVLKYTENDWRGNLRAWYNSNYSKEPLIGAKWLPKLDTRKYIVVRELLMCAEVSSESKGESLTIDDVLFANRALSMDPYRTVGEDNATDHIYNILSDDGDTLTIEPDMDNWST